MIGFLHPWGTAIAAGVISFVGLDRIGSKRKPASKPPVTDLQNANSASAVTNSSDPDLAPGSSLSEQDPPQGIDDKYAQPDKSESSAGTEAEAEDPTAVEEARMAAKNKTKVGNTLKIYVEALGKWRDATQDEQRTHLEGMRARRIRKKLKDVSDKYADTTNRARSRETVPTETLSLQSSTAIIGAAIGLIGQDVLQAQKAVRKAANKSKETEEAQQKSETDLKTKSEAVGLQQEIVERASKRLEELRSEATEAQTMLKSSTQAHEAAKKELDTLTNIAAMKKDGAEERVRLNIENLRNKAASEVEARQRKAEEAVARRREILLRRPELENEIALVMKNTSDIESLTCAAAVSQNLVEDANALLESDQPILQRFSSFFTEAPVDSASTLLSSSTATSTSTSSSAPLFEEENTNVYTIGSRPKPTARRTRSSSAHPASSAHQDHSEQESEPPNKNRVLRSKRKLIFGGSYLTQ